MGPKYRWSCYMKVSTKPFIFVLNHKGLEFAMYFSMCSVLNLGALIQILLFICTLT